MAYDHDTIKTYDLLYTHNILEGYINSIEMKVVYSLYAVEEKSARYLVWQSLNKYMV